MKIIRINLIFFILIGLSFLALIGCTVQPTETPPGETTQEQNTAQPPVENTPQATNPFEGEVISETTPMPTATPGIVYELVEKVVQQTGIGNKFLFGVRTNDWINFGISVGLILLGVIVITPFMMWLLQNFFSKTPLETDVSLFQSAEKKLRLILNTMFFDMATRRLLFLPASWKGFLNQIYFLIYALAITIILWHWIDILLNHFFKGGESEREKKRTEMLRTLFNRAAKASLLIISSIIILGYFGVNMLAFSAAIGIGGLAISLAAQDTLSDAINGFLILMDEPFRIGDRIEIRDLDTWGDVVDIGLRTTRILTLDNRMVILPNSKIGKSQIVNYSFPDPKYRVQTTIQVNYGNDLETIRKIIKEAMKEIEGVLQTKPVNVYLDSFDSSSIYLRVRWWLNSFEDRPENFNRVVSTIYDSLRANGITMPVDSYEIYLKSSAPLMETDDKSDE